MTGRLSSAMPFVLMPKKFLDVERGALAGVERSNDLVDLGAELAEFLHVRKQPPTNLLLVGIRQVCNFCNC
jgi:hypothetical protein